MEAIVHVDHPETMPSQSQITYTQRAAGLHGRSNQNQSGEPCPYKTGQQQRNPGMGHSYGPLASPGYIPMRYVHQSPYAPTPGAAAVSYREASFSTRSGAIVSERNQNMDFVRNEAIANQSRPRISLLPTSDFIGPSHRNRLHVNEAYLPAVAYNPTPPDNTPMKKIRLSEPKPESQRSLRIDTRDDCPSGSTYNPQVEAISPTLPPELQEDANFRSTKDELLHGIAKVDREITKTEVQINKLRKKQQELEEAAKKPPIIKEEEEAPQPKHHSPAQKIYAENRKKAHEAHSLLDSLGPKIDLPLYNQPSDTTVYHENKRKHAIFKAKLLEYLRRKHVEREHREKYLTATYSRLVQEWLRKVEKVENSQKRKAKEAKNREFFEKVFPKLRKQREDRERFNRVGARVKSEADLEEIMDGLQEQEMEEKKMRSYAVVPPLLLDARQRSVYYVNNNGRLDDFAADYKERQLLNVWTQTEKEIFKEKFLQHPKNFGIIASFLERKSVCDCVQYYYLSKKTENYKRLLRKSRQRSRAGRNPPGKVNSSTVGTGSIDNILNTASGVTTRLQREQLQKQEPLQSSTNNDFPISDCDNSSSFLMDNNQDTPPLLLPANTNDIKLEPKRKDRRKDDKKKKEEDGGESTDEESYDNQGGDILSGTTVACAVCKTESNCSRALPRAQASQYGLKEEDIGADARVCNLCRCKSVRSRITNCPLPSCPNAKSFHRIKRLRPLPSKWHELPPSVKNPIANELQLDPSITKCCSACFNRILRKISLVFDIDPMPAEEQDLSPSRSNQMLSWTDEETEALKKGMRSHGTRWSEVSKVVGPTKTMHQCKTFFLHYRKKLGLDLIIQEYNASHNHEERKPVVTDEEESGSSTSSCDETGADIGDSDTASAASPTQNIITEKTEALPEKRVTPQVSSFNPSYVENREEPSLKSSGLQEARDSTPPPTLAPALPQSLQTCKEDYDSSATETADEGQGGGEPDAGATRPPSTKRDDNTSSPLTVKDIMLGVIEMQLMKNQNQGQVSVVTPGPPTISSILKTDHSLNYGQKEKQPSCVVDNSLATLSVVSSQHPHQSTPEIPKESLVVQAIRDTRDPEGVTLDLSIKKPRESMFSHVTKAPPPPPPIQVQPHAYRVSQPPPPEHPSYYHPVLVSSVGQKLSPVMMPSGGGGAPSSKSQCGSIIHGTPVSSPNTCAQPRYDQGPSTIIRQVTPPHKETGSITQGTPVHQRNTLYPTSNPDYYSKRGLSFYQPRPPTYSVEQRQIIMNDYITSQQMHGPSTSSSSRSNRDKLFYQPNIRQGVIQRHNTKSPPPPPVSHYPPPGHEAFSSLVDVAVRQPSLPVPPSVNMSVSDHKSCSDDKRQMQEGLGERFSKENTRDSTASPSGRNRNTEASSTLTAASLIDAIITHQINQSSEPPCPAISSAAQQQQPTRPGDRLFQGFHRDLPDSNGKISPMKSLNPEQKTIQMSVPQSQVPPHPTPQQVIGPPDHLDAYNTPQSHVSRSGAYQGYETQTWKLRRALQHKDLDHIQPRDKGEERTIVRYYQEPPVSLSPLDYVKNRIAEVMRTSEEEGGSKGAISPDHPDMLNDSESAVCPPSSYISTSHTYTYPFSALNLNAGGGGNPPIPNASVSKPDPLPEPAPLLSAQYEPLSDED